LEAGETVEAAAVREVAEETSVEARPAAIGGVRDYIERDPTGRVRWHYVLIDVVCEALRGEPVPASDAEHARFLPLRELGDYDVTPTAAEAIEAAARHRSP
jgi:ADP-ribose pyrophosphatase YjhB (NUDIX family)